MNCQKRFAAALLAFVGLAPLAAQAQLSQSPEVQQAYDEGVQLLKEKKYPEALAKLNQALRVEGSFAEAHIAKGDALKALEAYQEAGNAYTAALNIDTNSAAAYNGRGECFMEMNPPAYDMALNDFNNALNLDRSNAKALSNLGHVLVSSGQSDPTNSILRLDEALAIDPTDARALRDRGLAHAQLAEYDKATVDLKKAVEADATDYETYQTLALVQGIQEQYADAVDAWTKAIENYTPKHKSSPTSFNSGYISRAEARMKLAEKESDPAKRTAALEAAVADTNAVLDAYPDRFPDSGNALFRRGRAERMLERYTDAVDSFQKALQATNGQEVPYASEAYLFRGICFFYIGSLDLARGDFEQASSTGNGFGDPRIYLWLGYTYHKQDDYRRAIDYYNQAIAKAPNFALAHINKGRAYMDLKEYNKAVECFNNAIRSEPDVGEHYYNVGVAYLKQEKFKTASDFLDLALRKDDPKPKYFHTMAEALRGLKRDDLAAEYDRKGDAAEPKKAS